MPQEDDAGIHDTAYIRAGELVRQGLNVRMVMEDLVKEDFPKAAIFSAVARRFRRISQSNKQHALRVFFYAFLLLVAGGITTLIMSSGLMTGAIIWNVRFFFLALCIIYIGRGLVALFFVWRTNVSDQEIENLYMSLAQSHE